ncbi:hypothetical protein HDU98_005185, partial [Podochytrium sp. JEL0797]
TLSRYAGFYKGTQALGAGIAWMLTGFAFTEEKGNALSNTSQFWIMVAPVVVSCLLFGVFVKIFVKDTTDASPEAVKSADEK